MSSLDQPIFWAPEVLPTVIAVGPSRAIAAGNGLSLAHLSTGEIRQAADGWHVVLRVREVEHRLWLRQPPVIGETYAAEMSFDEDFDIRANAARRLWRTLRGRAAGPALYALSPQRRRRLSMALRALDARVEGNSYRGIAVVLFGGKSIPERAWKTHDLRNRTIRLVQTGFALMRGGYRGLLHRPERKKRKSG
uniref:T6SS Transcription factor RovC-like DNA binding domain-containing protein n=1 Tax=Rhodopseudomonas palustris (strain BisA53) TaxID=316055 RepID=Q07JC4_RHOP5